MSTVISVENLSKSYRLGQIGTGTLTNDLKLWWAKKRGLPNPLLKIGQTDHGNRDCSADPLALLYSFGFMVVIVALGAVMFNRVEATLMDPV